MKSLFMLFAVLTFTTGSAYGQIKVTDNLSITGFLDMSTVYDNVTKINTMSFDQLEIDLLYDYGNGITARADLNSLAGGAVEFEQGFVTYASPNGFSVTAGKFLSVSGWETAEPDGLFQYSTSATLVYGGYQNGIGLAYNDEKFGLYGSLVSSVWSGSDTNGDEIGFEAQVTLKPVEGFLTKIALLWEDMGAFNTSLVNGWVSYATGPVTIAGELNVLKNWQAQNVDGTGYLGMVNVALSDKVGVTGRYSALDLDNAVTANEVTLSPSYSFTNNWLILAELRRDLTKGSKMTRFAVETLFSF